VRGVARALMLPNAQKSRPSHTPHGEETLEYLLPNSQVYLQISECLAPN
jgi:hypothetical protein